MEVRERRLPGFLYADDLVLCGKSKEDLRAMVGHFVEVCKVNPGKKMVRRRDWSVEVGVDGTPLEHVLEFKYLRWVLDE